MNRIANFFKGIGNFVEALNQYDRDDIHNDDDVRNDDGLHSKKIHDAMSKASSKVANFIGKIVGREVEKFLHDNKFQEPSVEKQQKMISLSKAQVSDQDTKSFGPMALIWHIVTTVVKYVCLTCMYIILSHAKLINNQRLYV